jgi:hypothetical protein
MVGTQLSAEPARDRKAALDETHIGIEGERRLCGCL